jgi:hypothetical protein
MMEGPSSPFSLNNFFRMSHILGVDYDDGRRLYHGEWEVNVAQGSIQILP